MIIIVGLPGAGKTTWAINMQKTHPEKRYNIIGTDTLIDKMRVMGLPRKRNYAGRWEVLIDKATKCLNKFFTMGEFSFFLGLIFYQQPFVVSGTSMLSVIEGGLDHTLHTSTLSHHVQGTKPLWYDGRKLFRTGLQQNDRIKSCEKYICQCPNT